jgi:hypothetical integral membrane protein (TIGR02206 family)
MTSFRPFGFQHFLPAGIALVGMSIIAAIGWRLNNSPRERTMRLSIAWTCFAYAVFVSLWYVSPWKLVWSRSLPLHMCDVMVLLAPLALITHNRTLRTLNCFWGVTLCTQAFMTPILSIGLDDMEFYTFWTSHAVIVGSSLYDYAAGRFRPRLRDYKVCVGWGLVWIVTVFLVNILLEKLGYPGANYGYVGQSIPGQPTIVDKLGPWPFRAVLIAVVAISACGGTFLGSKLFERCEGSRENPRRWPTIATLVAFFSIGVAMLIAGTIDAMDPKPPEPKAVTPPGPAGS